MAYKTFITLKGGYKVREEGKGEEEERERTESGERYPPLGDKRGGT